MHENLNIIGNTERNKIQVGSIKNALTDFKNGNKKMSGKKRELNSQIKQQILLKRFLVLVKEEKKDN